MRNKRIIAAVSTLAVGGVVATGAIATASATPAAASHVHVVSHSAASSPARILSTSSALGRLLDSVGRVTGETKAKHTPSAAGLHRMVLDVKSASHGLEQAVAARHRALPVAPAAAAGAVSPVLKQALAKLQADVQGLVAAIKSGNQAKITAAMQKVAQDLLAVLKSVVSGLGGAAGGLGA